MDTKSAIRRLFFVFVFFKHAVSRSCLINWMPSPKALTPIKRRGQERGKRSLLPPSKLAPCGAIVLFLHRPHYKSKHLRSVRLRLVGSGHSVMRLGRNPAGSAEIQTSQARSRMHTRGGVSSRPACVCARISIILLPSNGSAPETLN